MEVSGLGVTGKHRSKHQINQLMASAISLEAHRASEAELARFGAGAGGKGNSEKIRLVNVFVNQIFTGID